MIRGGYTQKPRNVSLPRNKINIYSVGAVDFIGEFPETGSNNNNSRIIIFYE